MYQDFLILRTLLVLTKSFGLKYLTFQKVFINYRAARQIARFMFQTLLRRTALAVQIRSSAVWARDKALFCGVISVSAI